MTAEEYKIIRTSGRVGSQMFYEYWQENKKPYYPSLSRADFEFQFMAFIGFCNEGLIQVPDGTDKFIRAELIRNKVVTYFDNKFGLTKENKDNETGN